MKRFRGKILKDLSTFVSKCDCHPHLLSSRTCVFVFIPRVCFGFWYGSHEMHCSVQRWIIIERITNIVKRVWCKICTCLSFCCNPMRIFMERHRFTRFCAQFATMLKMISLFCYDEQKARTYNETGNSGWIYENVTKANVEEKNGFGAKLYFDVIQFSVGIFGWPTTNPLLEFTLFARVCIIW